MKSIVKASQRTVVEDAIVEATNGISSPDGIIFMSDYARFEQFSSKLSEMYPNADIIGTAGTVYCGNMIDDRNIFIITAITGDASLSGGILEGVSKTPLRYMYRLSDSVRKVSPGEDNTVCIEFCTSNEEVLVSSLNVVLDPAGIGLAGGTVFGAPEGRPSLVSYNGKIYDDACAYMVIKNKSGKAYVIRENIYDKGDGPEHTATKVNLAKKELIELDNRPAADVYMEETGVSRNELVDNVMKAPFGRVIDQDIYISSMNGVTSSGSITNYKRINQNDSLCILKLLDYCEINRDTRDEIKGLVSKPSLIFSINCIYRYLLFQNEGYLNEFLRDMSSVAPFVGYIGGGEQYNRQHVNQTMVCAVFA
jgi:hypothetical protein